MSDPLESILKTIFEKLKKETAIIAFGVVLVGYFLFQFNQGSRIATFLGAGLICIGAVFIAIIFVFLLIYEDRQETKKHYSHIISLYKNFQKSPDHGTQLDNAGERIGGRHGYKATKDSTETSDN
jgi:hypothetical protein